jgi:hypothetical protein
MDTYRERVPDNSYATVYDLAFIDHGSSINVPACTHP